MVNKVRVNIAGAQYAFATTDSEKYITSLAEKLDRDIGKLMEANPSLPVTKAAVFCAMDYLDEYQKSTGSAENMRSQIQDYIADAARARSAEDKLRAENEALRREAAALREQLDRLRRHDKDKEKDKDRQPYPEDGQPGGTPYTSRGELWHELRSWPLWAVKKCSAPPCTAAPTRFIWDLRASTHGAARGILTPPACARRSVFVMPAGCGCTWR